MHAVDGIIALTLDIQFVDFTVPTANWPARRISMIALPGINTTGVIVNVKSAGYPWDI